MIKNKFDIILYLSGIAVACLLIINLNIVSDIRYYRNIIIENQELELNGFKYNLHRTKSLHDIYKIKYKLKILNELKQPDEPDLTHDPIKNFQLLQDFRDTIDNYSSKVNFMWEDYLDEFRLFKPYDEDTIYFSFYQWQKQEEIYEFLVNGKQYNYQLLDHIIIPKEKLYKIELNKIFVNNIKIDTIKIEKLINLDNLKNIKKYKNRKTINLQSSEEHVFMWGT